jgi:hypothetical protein
MSEELNRSIGRLESKVDTLLDNHKSLYVKLDTHDNRLRDLEAHKSYFIGVVAAVGSGAAILVEVIKHKIFGQ